MHNMKFYNIVRHLQDRSTLIYTAKVESSHFFGKMSLQ